MADTSPRYMISTPEQNPVTAAVLVLGNFDGVHRGHHFVIKTALAQAERLGGVPTRIITLEPHPESVLRPDAPPFRLTPENVKISLLKAIPGVEDVRTLHFSSEFAKIEAHDFVEEFLLKQNNACHIVAGFDFVFGSKRSGNMQNLCRWLLPKGIGVTEVSPYCDSKGKVMSSSRVRTALREGDLDTARHILGRPWSIEGLVQPGVQFGQTLGFPTANMPLDDYLRPKFGSYAIYARRSGETKVYPGIANIGVRPTTTNGGGEELLEFHLFDFYDTIYGQDWEIELIKFIRPEALFPDVHSLQKKIAEDIIVAKTILAQN